MGRVGRTAFALLLGLAGTASSRLVLAQAGAPNATAATVTVIVRLDSRGLTSDEDGAVERALKRLEKRGRTSVKLAPLSYSDISLMIGCPQERGGCARLMSKHLSAQRLFYVEPVREGPRGPVHARLTLVRADGTVEREASREVATGAAMTAALEPIGEAFLAGNLPPAGPSAASIAAAARPAPEAPVTPRTTEVPRPAPAAAVASAATPPAASRTESSHARPHPRRAEPPPPVVVERPALVAPRPVAPEPSEPRRRMPLLRAPTYIAGAVAIGLLGASTFFAVQFQSAQAAFDAAPCETSAQIRACVALLDTARRDALLADIGFIAAGAAALGTAVLVYVDLRAHTLSDEAIAISPMLGPGLAGLTVRGRFE